MARAALVVALLGLPAGPARADHSTPVTVWASSAHQGVCRSATAAPVAVPAAWTGALAANALLAPAYRIPADLKGGTPPGSRAGACTYGTDAAWTAAAPAAGVPGCTASTFTTCKGLHDPAFGAPLRPGRFLDFAVGSIQSAGNVCAYASSAGQAGTCTALALGYLDKTPASLGAYCKHSRALFWGLHGDAALTPASRAYFVAVSSPASAGQIVPITGVTTGSNWSKRAGHYTGWAGGSGGSWIGYPAGVNVFGLGTHRACTGGIDSCALYPQSCQGGPSSGLRHFFAQRVMVALGR